MFKYKSPLSRLLEGSSKHANKDKSHVEEHDDADDEPIADLHALRQVLAGGNQTTEADADADESTEEPAVTDTQVDEVPVESSASLEVEELPVADENAWDEETDADEIVNTILAEDLPGRTASIEPLEAPELAEAPTPEVAAAAPDADRSERVKTTFLGFERPDAHVQDSMEADPISKPMVAQASFPVGWLVITEGPGRGTSFPLIEGLAQIGRNDDQAVQLDFGDNGISRAGHAVVAYNAEDRTCYLGHGGKANLVRLNGGPVLSTVPLSNGDMIRISDTNLRFVAFCDDRFDWQDS
ncbi:FHA domain-containing protein [Aliiroseovarius sp. S253]|uniref:FHA domain-containing protein n=1 Tax=Aliiroseovarius sp. S253 TaxID=3415133 RepID=UPI003C7B7FC6